jgi:hypothetical protein
LKHFLDKEDSVNHRKALNRLDKWIAEHLKKKQPAHPFGVVGAIKEYEYDRVANENK